MFAPRRIGKTWLIHKLAEDLRAEGWVTILVDVEGMRTEKEFLRASAASSKKPAIPRSAPSPT